jgi:hypothetical protein
MANLNDCLSQARQLSPGDQERLVAELSRSVVARHMADLAQGPAAPIPLNDEEIEQLVHEARRETLRASGL